LIVLLLVLFPARVLAHDGRLATAFDLFPIVAIAISAVVYARGVRVLWARAGRGRGVRPWQVTSFGAAVLTMWLALASPIDARAALTFSAHMTQHELLMLVAAPLFVYGAPLVVMLWGLPVSWRDRVALVSHAKPLRRAWSVATHPAAAFGLHAVVLWVWHVPIFFNAAMERDLVHAIQHASFVLTAALFWWGMLSGRYGRLGYGAAVCYVFLTAVHSSLLGALLTLAPAPWYAPYVTTAAQRAMDPLVDQQLAGLLMWVPSGIIFIALGLALMAAWLAEASRRARLDAPSHLGTHR
jgi:putative membrane protein